jgi:GNAT superfamily N-acetyltransferase
MTDMIVSLQTLPAPAVLPEGVSLAPAKPYDRNTIVGWVRAEFGDAWASEVACGFGQHPCRVLVVSRAEALLGFACFDVTFPAFFGPTGVVEDARGLGLGKALLIEALWALKAQGYVYGFIGDAGPMAFYQKTVGAVPLPDSLSGGYTPPLAASGLPIK